MFIQRRSASVTHPAALAALAALTLALTAVGCASGSEEAGVEDEAEGAAVSGQAFICNKAEISKDDKNAPYGQVVAVRAAGHQGYDRFVMEFARGPGAVPNYHLARQAGATFFHDGSGDPVTVPGSAGLDVTVHSASGYDFTHDRPSYTGPSRFKVGGAKIMTDAVNTGDFEGYVSWGIGLDRSGCYRVAELTNPPRLVIDVQNNGAAPPTPPEPAGTAFKCGVSQIGAKSSNGAGYGKLVGVRTAGHEEYDRFVMEFSADSKVPDFTVTMQDNAAFNGPGEGPAASFTLPGTAGLNISVRSASAYDPTTGQQTYTGPLALTTAAGKVMTQARQYEDFEGYLGWGIGLQHGVCYRAFKLADPPRLVVDVSHDY